MTVTNVKVHIPQDMMRLTNYSLYCELLLVINVYKIDHFSSSLCCVFVNTDNFNCNSVKILIEDL